MRQNYKPLLISIIMILVITSGLLLLSTYDATQANTPNCERIRSECVPDDERPACPNINLTPRCPMSAAKERRD